jgi:iron complex transport system permease protein
LGVDLRRCRLWVVVWTAVLVGSAVALVGGEAFIGLVVPHALRLLRGPAHRPLVGLCAICGALALILCDQVAFRLVSGGILPLGAVTALIGAPLVAVLLWRRRSDAVVG